MPEKELGQLRENTCCECESSWSWKFSRQDLPSPLSKMHLLVENNMKIYSPSKFCWFCSRESTKMEVSPKCGLPWRLSLHPVSSSLWCGIGGGLPWCPDHQCFWKSKSWFWSTLKEHSIAWSACHAPGFAGVRFKWSVC